MKSILKLILLMSFLNCSHKSIQNDSIAKLKVFTSLLSILKSHNFPITIAAIPIEPNQNSERFIQAKGEWQIANDKIDGNVQVTLTAVGSWSMTNDKSTFGPEGVSANPSYFSDYRVDKSFNHGQLICRVNTQPSILFSTSSLTFNGTGAIECRINDIDVSNNSGYLIVTVNVTLL